MDSPKLEDLGEDPTDTEWSALRSCGEGFTEDVDDVVLTYGNSNEQVARGSARDDLRNRVSKVQFGAVMLRLTLIYEVKSLWQ